LCFVDTATSGETERCGTEADEGRERRKELLMIVMITSGVVVCFEF